MKKVFITILLFLPLMMSAQDVLTPQQQLEKAQKELEAAKKAVEEAKAKAAKAEAQRAKAEEARTKAEAEKVKAEAEKLKKEAERINAETDKKQKNLNTPVTLPAIGGQPVVTGDESSTQVKKQTAWEIPTTEKKTDKKATKETPKKLANGATLKVDAKYLEGAVTTDANGKVEFVLDTDANGKSAQQIYNIVYDYMNSLTQEKQNIASRVALVNPEEHIIANTMDEWLTFSSSFISLDRTEFKYQLVANISDNHLKLTMLRLNYIYEEGRSTGFKEPAENIITDKVALTKKKNDLAKIYGKFRRRTIDRKEQIFNGISFLIKQ